MYLSPITAAQPGSMHGYDVIDPTIVNPELGGRAALEVLCGTAHAAGLGVMIDIVPNHEAATTANARWCAALAAHDRGWFDLDWPDGKPRYRRFFDVDGLVGVRVEDEGVFRASHALVFDLVGHGVVDGLRIDHVDGLAGPAEYLRRLRAAVGDAFVVVEKILAHDEVLRELAGRGYDRLRGRRRARRRCASIRGGAPASWPRCWRRTGRSRSGSSSTSVRPWCSTRSSGRNGSGCSTCSTIPDRPTRCTRRRSGSACIAPTAPGRRIGRGWNEPRPARRTARPRDSSNGSWWIRRPSSSHDGVSSPRAVMAKGHEDTACYRFPALLAQNEVGGDPGADTAAAVAYFQHRARRFGGLVGTSTHDSKRSEDVRARLCVLSERSAEFEAGLRRWRELVEPDPDVTASESRFVAQTLLGAWPLTTDSLPEFTTRISEYLTKALREAKLETNWIEPDEAHEQLVIDTARRTTAGDGRLLSDAFGSLVDDVMFFGALNSLSMLTWKLAMPGVPDIYRGCELWDFSLVDPDNRRPVDFDRRRSMLDAAARADHAELLADWRSGAIKLHVTAAGLRARREHADLFRSGEYVPIDTPPGLFGFARRLDDEWAVAVAPRLATGTATTGQWPLGADAWGDAVVRLPDRDATVISLAAAAGDAAVRDRGVLCVRRARRLNVGSTGPVRCRPAGSAATSACRWL